MVAGQRIDEAAVSTFVANAVIVIAHNAGFDRKFAERYWPVFEKAWLLGDRDRMAKARLRRGAPGLSPERRGLLPPGS
jgi:DNA polymerase-3 subunit epsilon